MFGNLRETVSLHVWLNARLYGRSKMLASFQAIFAAVSFFFPLLLPECSILYLFQPWIYTLQISEMLHDEVGSESKYEGSF